MTTKLMLVIGARPQFIKTAPVIAQIKGRRSFELLIVHSGQHYDPEMSSIFFRELSIPAPSVNLQSGSGSHARQTARIMMGLENQIIKNKPDMVMVPGDTNTTLAGALTAAKLCVPVAHIEAGLRSGDTTMPEEVNRRLTDHCSSLLFAPTRTATRNLAKEGLSKFTYLTGDTMVDALRTVLPILQKHEDGVLEKFGIDVKDYVLVTLHRPSNVDDLDRLRRIRLALLKVARKVRVVFLVHPRTRSMLAKLGTTERSSDAPILFARPQGYVETLALLRNARALLTDSGGMQKESFLLHVPCITLRSTTEWPETLVGSANRLLTEPHMIPEAVFAVALDENPGNMIKRLRKPFGNGHASTKIVTIIEKAIRERSTLWPSRHR